MLLASVVLVTCFCGRFAPPPSGCCSEVSLGHSVPSPRACRCLGSLSHRYRPWGLRVTPSILLPALPWPYGYLGLYATWVWHRTEGRSLGGYSFTRHHPSGSPTVWRLEGSSCEILFPLSGEIACRLKGKAHILEWSSSAFQYQVGNFFF